jgi:DMSO/TMAO reductase YedYZ molybdopterin-dependent catalytic subunit
MTTLGNNRKWMPIGRVALWLGLLLVALTACAGGAPKVDWTLKVTGDVATPLDLDYATLAEMPQIELDDLLMQKSLGEDEIRSWSGVPIETLFEQAGVGDYATVTAIAADGYAIEVTRDEIQGGIVALKLGGEWITKAEADKGPIRLVTPETPANRWVFQLTASCTVPAIKADYGTAAGHTYSNQP